MPNISAYVRRWVDEVTCEPVIEVRIEAAHDAAAEAMAAAAYAAGRVAIIEFSARRHNGEPPANDGDSSGATTNPTAPRPPAPSDTGFATMRDELLKEGHTNDDWAKLIEQRQKEHDAFRRAFVELPRYDIGARVPALYPGEPAPTIVSPDFLNMIPKEIEALVEASRASRPSSTLSRDSAEACLRSSLFPETNRRSRGTLARLLSSFRCWLGKTP